MADGITKDNIKQWLAEYEAINGVTVKIKASKKLSNEYVLRHYYRCTTTRVTVPVKVDFHCRVIFTCVRYTDVNFNWLYDCAVFCCKARRKR